MAFTANTMFEARVTNAVFDEIANVTGKYQSSGSDADCSAGFLCVRGATRLANEGYTSIYNDNAYIFGAAAATEQKFTGADAKKAHPAPLPQGQRTIVFQQHRALHSSLLRQCPNNIICFAVKLAINIPQQPASTL